jgi:aminocarboxymuconate-semialdehyde decarboxylase
LIFSGVLDRFPELQLILAHGGAFPCLLGRFDLMHQRMDRAAQGDVATAPPSAYVGRFHYDTILHDPRILRFLAAMAGVDRIVLGSDYSFPPADLDLVGTVCRAGFTDAEMRQILDDNAQRLMPRLQQA